MVCSPPGSSVHADSPCKNTGVGCHSLLQGNLPDAGIEPRSPALQAESLLSEPLVEGSKGMGWERGWGAPKPQHRIGSYFCNKLLESSGSAFDLLTSRAHQPASSFLKQKP